MSLTYSLFIDINLVNLKKREDESIDGTENLPQKAEPDSFVFM